MDWRESSLENESLAQEEGNCVRHELNAFSPTAITTSAHYIVRACVIALW